MSLYPTPTPLPFIESLGPNGKELLITAVTSLIAGACSIVIAALKACKSDHYENVEMLAVV